MWCWYNKYINLNQSFRNTQKIRCMRPCLWSWFMSSSIPPICSATKSFACKVAWFRFHNDPKLILGSFSFQHVSTQIFAFLIFRNLGPFSKAGLVCFWCWDPHGTNVWALGENAATNSNIKWDQAHSCDQRVTPRTPAFWSHTDQTISKRILRKSMQISVTALACAKANQSIRITNLSTCLADLNEGMNCRLARAQSSIPAPLLPAKGQLGDVIPPQ